MGVTGCPVVDRGVYPAGSASGRAYGIGKTRCRCGDSVSVAVAPEPGRAAHA
jgi:hypothetical protein